jgi:hypothetical protein
MTADVVRLIPGQQPRPSERARVSRRVYELTRMAQYLEAHRPIAFAAVHMLTKKLMRWSQLDGAPSLTAELLAITTEPDRKKGGA